MCYHAYSFKLNHIKKAKAKNANNKKCYVEQVLTSVDQNITSKITVLSVTYAI